tara:strand:+ start:484 stop:696 length:213 start_codon:yes stop_codon:yes gene_type:complete
MISQNGRLVNDTFRQDQKDNEINEDQQKLKELEMKVNKMKMVSNNINLEVQNKELLSKEHFKSSQDYRSK